MKKERFQYSVEYAEEESSKRIIPCIRKHMDYATKVYNILCRTNWLLGDKNIQDIPYTHFVHQVIIARIADFLRPIILLSQLGYVDQAATLAASIFELSHMLLYIDCDDKRAELWKKADDFKKEMPRKVFGLSWADLVAANKETYDDSVMNKHEYNVYKQLCWMKHSLPALQGMCYDERTRGCRVRFAPFCDEQAVRTASFALFHSGRYGQLAVWSLFLNHTLEDDKITKMQIEASELRRVLVEDGVEKYGSKSLFEQER